MSDTKSPFGKDYEPVDYDTEDIRNYIQGAKVVYAGEIKPAKMIHILFDNSFIRINELLWYAKEHDLTVSHITAVTSEKNPRSVGLDVMFYRGWINPLE